MQPSTKKSRTPHRSACRPEFIPADVGFPDPAGRKGEQTIDEVVDVMGRATVEAVLQMSAEQVAGRKAQGCRGPDREVYWHGVQGGRVALKERQLRVAKPRLHKKRRRTDESGEVEVPAYTALQSDQRLADRMLELVLNGVSTRRYEKVPPAMADQVGISKSEVSRETIEAGTRVLQELAEQDLSASWTYWWSTSTGSCSGTTT